MQIRETRFNLAKYHKEKDSKYIQSQFVNMSVELKCVDMPKRAQSKHDVHDVHLLIITLLGSSRL